MQMAKELDVILDKTEAVPAASCMGENGSVSYLQKVICPIYETVAAVSGSFTLLLYWWLTFKEFSRLLIALGGVC